MDICQLSSKFTKLPKAMSNDENKCIITGIVKSIAPLRFTPAGFPVLTIEIVHSSQQIENGALREVVLDMKVKAVGDVAKLVGVAQANLPMQRKLRVEGFLANQSRKRHLPILHARHIDWL